METVQRSVVVRGSKEGKEKRKEESRRRRDRAQGIFKAVKLFF